MRNYFLIIFVVLGVVVADSEACFSPPEGMYLPHKEAIEGAVWIARVEPKSIDRTGDRPVYTLEVLEYVKGDGPKKITMEGVEPYGSDFWSSYYAANDEPHPAEANYYGHKASSFWVNGGRAGNASDCEIHPAFVFSGAEYLLFGPESYSVGFENITSTDDSWLSYVRAVVAGEGSARPVTLNSKKYLENAEAVVLIEQSWFQGSPVTSVEILKGEKREYLSMLHIAPHDEAMSVLRPECRDKKPYLKRRSPIRRRLVVFEFLPVEEIRFSEGYDCVGANLEAQASVESYGVYSRNGRMVFYVREDRILPQLVRHGEETLLEGMTLSDVRRIFSE